MGCWMGIEGMRQTYVREEETDANVMEEMERLLIPFVCEEVISTCIEPWLVTPDVVTPIMVPRFMVPPIMVTSIVVAFTMMIHAFWSSFAVTP